MCTEVDGQKLSDTARLQVLREIEEESKFVPSQFEPSKTIGAAIDLSFSSGYEKGWREGLQAGIAAAQLVLEGATTNEAIAAVNTRRSEI